MRHMWQAYEAAIAVLKLRGWRSLHEKSWELHYQTICELQEVLENPPRDRGRRPYLRSRGSCFHSLERLTSQAIRSPGAVWYHICGTTFPNGAPSR